MKHGAPIFLLRRAVLSLHASSLAEVCRSFQLFFTLDAGFCFLADHLNKHLPSMYPFLLLQHLIGVELHNITTRR